MVDINIAKNKQRFIELLRKIDRPGADIPALIYKLEHSDFFEGPCSTKYHLNVKGGNCHHCLYVYDILVKLNEVFNTKLSDESMIISALCHDLDKMDKYELTSRNVKQYNDKGKYSDTKGKFDWVTEDSYVIKNPEDRFTYGHHGQNSEYIANSYIPLTLEESAAITNHMGKNDEYNSYDATPIFNKFTLAAMLHMADCLSTFVVETGKSDSFDNIGEDCE